jgi:hypothetical protein
MEMALCYWFNANDCGVPWSSSRVDDGFNVRFFVRSHVMMCVESRGRVSNVRLTGTERTRQADSPGQKQGILIFAPLLVEYNFYEVHLLPSLEIQIQPRIASSI